MSNVNLNMGFVLLVLMYIVHCTMACGGCGCDGGCYNRLRDCQDVQKVTQTTGVYTIYPNCTNGFQVRCDMHTAGGGWTVIQRRYNNDSFYRDWLSYQNGFGSLLGPHWLGNQKIHAITYQGLYKLRIDMVYENQTKYAEYDLFTIAGADDKFRLKVGKYSGNAGNSLRIHNGMQFSTYDSDSDAYTGNCASKYHGAWWYNKCHDSNLNGLYGSRYHGKGINWRSLTGYLTSLQKVEMKIRRARDV